MTKKNEYVLKDQEYIKLIENFLSGKDYKNVFIFNKKYKELLFEVPSYKYNAVNLILEYLKDKAEIVDHIYNYKGKYDYCTIFVYKLIE